MSEQPKIFKNKSERNDFGIALFVICLVFGFIFYTAFSKSFSKSNDLSISEATTSKPVFTKEVGNDLTTTLLSKKENQERLDNYIRKTNRKNRRFVITSTEREVTTDAEEVRIATDVEKGVKETIEEKSVEITTPETPVVTEDSKIVEENNSKIDAENNSVEATTNQSEESIDKNTAVTTSEDATPTASETVVTPPTVTKPTPKKETVKKEKSNKKPTTTTKDYDCLIVVGTFSNGINASKLERKLKKDGFTVHTFFRKTNKVISIPASCKYPIRQQKTLDKIKQQYAKDAWILRK